MKKLILFLVVIALSSCDTIFPTMKFKVIGSGTINVTYSDNGGTTQFTCNSKDFEREMSEGEFWYLSAQSSNGSGITVKAYIGNSLVKQCSSQGYGIAAISGVY